MTHLSAN